MTWDKEFQFAIDHAQANVRENTSTDTTSPIFLGFGTDPDTDKPCVVIVGTPFVGTTFDEVEESKNKAVRSIQVLWVAYAVQRYIFVSEAWMKEAKSKEAQERYRSERRLIADDPDRIEALMCVDVTYAGNRLAMFKMLRHDGKVDFELIDKEPTSFGGRMCSLLPDEERMKTLMTRELRKMGAEIIRKHGTAIGVHTIEEWGE
jgi:hypothetical protein